MQKSIFLFSSIQLYNMYMYNVPLSVLTNSTWESNNFYVKTFITPSLSLSERTTTSAWVPSLSSEMSDLIRQKTRMLPLRSTSSLCSLFLSSSPSSTWRPEDDWWQLDPRYTCTCNVANLHTRTAAHTCVIIMYVHMHIHVYMYMYMYMHTCIQYSTLVEGFFCRMMHYRIKIYIHMYMYVHYRTAESTNYLYMYRYMYMHMYTHCIHMGKCTCTCIGTYTLHTHCIFIWVKLHVYTYKCTHCIWVHVHCIWVG